MKKFSLLIASAFACFAIVAIGVFANVAPASACSGAECINDGKADAGDSTTESLDGANGPITAVVNTMLFIVGVGSVIMIIYSGIRYIFSGGNSGQITSAKNTLIYAIIGLAIAILAYAIVNFVIDNVK